MLHPQGLASTHVTSEPIRPVPALTCLTGHPRRDPLTSAQVLWRRLLTYFSVFQTRLLKTLADSSSGLVRGQNTLSLLAQAGRPLPQCEQIGAHGDRGPNQKYHTEMRLSEIQSGQLVREEDPFKR